VEWLKQTFIRVGVLPFLLVALIILFSLAESRFMTASNMITVSRQATYLAMITAGQMLTILCGGFDLSVGSSVALTSIVTAQTIVSLQHPAGGITAGVLVGIATGTALGALNGITISLFRVSPFVVTMGMMSVAHGLALLVSGGVPIFNLPDEFNSYLAIGSVWGIPVPLLVAAFVVATTHIMLTRTRVGRYFYALGGNEEAARLSGINVKKYSCLAYILCGSLAGLTGVMLTARVASGEPNLGAALPLESIAAAVIGGVSLRGGEGSLIGAVFGAILIVLIRNGMDLMNISSYLQMVVMGSLLVFAVVMDQFRLSLKGR
jgi:ribose transport system permease protein